MQQRLYALAAPSSASYLACCNHFVRLGADPTISIPMPLIPMDVGQLWTHLGIFNTGVGRNRYFGETTCSSSCRCCPVGRIVEREAHMLPLG